MEKTQRYKNRDDRYSQVKDPIPEEFVCMKNRPEKIATMITNVTEE